MAELVGSVTRDPGKVMRMSMAEVFVIRDGKIAERLGDRTEGARLPLSG